MKEIDESEEKKGPALYFPTNNNNSSSNDENKRRRWRWGRGYCLTAQITGRRHGGAQHTRSVVRSQMTNITAWGWDGMGWEKGKGKGRETKQILLACLIESPGPRGILYLISIPSPLTLPTRTISPPSLPGWEDRAQA